MDQNLLRELIDLRMAMLAAARPDTAYDVNQYEQRKEKSNLAGHCAAAAHVVQQQFGGDIVAGQVQGELHYWNRLPTGLEVDLTSDQFGGDGLNPLIQGRRVAARKSVNPRFVKFAQRVGEHKG